MVGDDTKIETGTNCRRVRGTQMQSLTGFDLQREAKSGQSSMGGIEVTVEIGVKSVRRVSRVSNGGRDASGRSQKTVELDANPPDIILENIMI